MLVYAGFKTLGSVESSNQAKTPSRRWSAAAVHSWNKPGWAGKTTDTTETRIAYRY